MKKSLIQQYSKETQAKIIDTLKAYSRVTVTVTPSGKETVSTGAVIKSSYTSEERNSTRRDVFSADLFTAKERNANYLETFGYKPFPAYK